MMSIESIRAMSRAAAAEACRQHKIPFVFEIEDLADLKVSHELTLLRKIPFLGDYVPKGWKRTDREELFVDSSGFGRDDEPALSVTQFIDAINAGFGYAITEAGQFQIYIAEYERAGMNP